MDEYEYSSITSQTLRAPTIRASVSFPFDMYKTLENIADKKKVSMAWVVREAVEMYLSDNGPLFRDKG